MGEEEVGPDSLLLDMRPRPWSRPDGTFSPPLETLSVCRVGLRGQSLLGAPIPFTLSCPHCRHHCPHSADVAVQALKVRKAALASKRQLRVHPCKESPGSTHLSNGLLWQSPLLLVGVIYSVQKTHSLEEVTSAGLF